ncbi:hypothetical protein [Caulobacter sp.]|uniref:hypothetical protein n=1 Tax=Caulobacter sp. TaxID=78 RepID=UPI003BB04607
MSGGKVLSACIRSDETVDLEPPYADTATSLCLYRQRGEVVANFALLGGGQFTCSAGTGCGLGLRIDEGKAVSVGASVPADYSHDVVIVNDGAGLLARIRRGEVLRIEATYYQAGSQVSTFAVKGLGDGVGGEAWKP